MFFSRKFEVKLRSTLPPDWPSPFHYKCSNKECRYANPPQALPGSFRCSAGKDGLSCQGSYIVSPSDAAATVRRFERDYERKAKTEQVEMARIEKKMEKERAEADKYEKDEEARRQAAAELAARYKAEKKRDVRRGIKSPLQELVDNSLERRPAQRKPNNTASTSSAGSMSKAASQTWSGCPAQRLQVRPVAAAVQAPRVKEVPRLVANFVAPHAQQVQHGPRPMPPSSSAASSHSKDKAKPQTSSRQQPLLKLMMKTRVEQRAAPGDATKVGTKEVVLPSPAQLAQRMEKAKKEHPEYMSDGHLLPLRRLPPVPNGANPSRTKAKAMPRWI